MRSSIRLAIVFAALTVSLGFPSCRVPPPTTPTGHVIACGKEALQECGPGALPAVNTCLAGDGDVVGCLLGLVQPAGCVTEGLIACLVRHEGAEFHAAAQANPDDVRSFRAAERARTFLSNRGYVFADGDAGAPAARPDRHVP